MNICRAISLICALATGLAILIILPSAAVADDPLAEARNLNSQAATLYQQRRYPEAEQVARRAVALVERASPDSPDLAVSLANLGELLRAQNRLAEAEPLFKRSLAIKEEVFGPDHLPGGRAFGDRA